MSAPAVQKATRAVPRGAGGRTPAVGVSAPTAGHCLHHWLIEAPAGPTSVGVCRGCGERRLFANAPTGGVPWSPEGNAVFFPLRPRGQRIG